MQDRTFKKISIGIVIIIFVVFIYASFTTWSGFFLHPDCDFFSTKTENIEVYTEQEIYESNNTLYNPTCIMGIKSTTKDGFLAGNEIDINVYTGYIEFDENKVKSISLINISIIFNPPIIDKEGKEKFLSQEIETELNGNNSYEFSYITYGIHYNTSGSKRIGVKANITDGNGSHNIFFSYENFIDVEPAYLTTQLKLTKAVVILAYWTVFFSLIMALDRIKDLILGINRQNKEIWRRRFNGGNEMDLSYERLTATIKKHWWLVLVYALFVIIISLIFYYYGYSIDTYITVLLTFVLAVSTLYYAIVSSNTFKLMRTKELYDLKPTFDWRIFKRIDKQKIIDIYFYLRNIGKGATKEIDFSVILASKVNNSMKYAYKQIKLYPLISGEETWIHVDIPFSIDDYSIQDNANGRSNSDSITFFMLYNNINDIKHTSTGDRVTGAMEIISQDREKEIYKIAEKNLCKLEEIDVDSFNQVSQSCRGNHERTLRQLIFYYQ